MSTDKIDNSRRRLLQGTASGLVTASVGSLLPMRVDADSPQTPKLDENVAAAIALGYKHDANKVDTVKFPARAGKSGASQFCRNCNLYLADENTEWAGCRIFPNTLVSANGWCTAWIRR